MFKNDWLGQMTGNGNCCCDLLIQVILVYVRVGIRNLVIIGVKVAMIVLDLNSCVDSLRTEGAFIPSGASRDDLWFQVKRIRINDIH